jgi:hypothetical protein
LINARPATPVVRDEYLAIDRTPAEMRRPRGYGTLGDLPLVVVRRGRTSRHHGVANARPCEVKKAISE